MTLHIDDTQAMIYLIICLTKDSMCPIFLWPQSQKNVSAVLCDIHRREYNYKEIAGWDISNMGVIL